MPSDNGERIAREVRYTSHGERCTMILHDKVQARTAEWDLEYIRRRWPQWTNVEATWKSRCS